MTRGPLPEDPAGGIDVRRGGGRFVTTEPGRTTRHSFSFDRHYDPQNVSLGFLLCHNEDLVQPGHGYPSHPHREVEVVTWVLQGALRHRDSTGRGGVVLPGQVQRLSAGTGVVHEETNGDRGDDRGDDPAPVPVHFVQMWLLPDETGRPPAYAQQDVGAALDTGGWVTLASGMPRYAEDAAVDLRNRRAALHVARLPAGRAVTLPTAPLSHLFVARGTVRTGATDLHAGDAARMTDPARWPVTAATDAEVLVWEMHPDPR